MKKFLTLLLCLTLTLTMMPGMVFAADEDAGTTELTVVTTADDLKEALTTSGTVKLGANIDASSSSLTVSANCEVTLDLAGYQLTLSNAQNGNLDIPKTATLTLTDSGENGKIVTNTDYSKTGQNPANTTIIFCKGTFNMTGGCIDTVRDEAADKGQFAIGVYETGTANLSGGKVEAGWYAVSGNGYDDDEPGTTINISGDIVLISTADYAVYHPQAGQLNITGGVISGASGAVAMNRGSVSISGGELNTSGTGSTGNWADGTGNLGDGALNINARYGNVTAKITGGTFIAEKNAVLIAKNENNTSTIDITGGTFSDDSASAYVPVGLTLVPKDDGTYGVAADEVNADAIASATDFNLWGEAHPGWYSVGWQYGDSFNTDLISRIEVYLTDAEGERILTYTASGDQLAYQKKNGYISDSNLSSAPFYKEYDGVEIPEGKDLDWTVEKGAAFDAFAAAKAYVVITVGDAKITLEQDCLHTHAWAADFTIDKEATETETGIKSKHCTGENCIARSEITVIPKISTGISGGGTTAPTVQKPTVEADANSTVTLSSDGTTATIVVADGYELADVTVNGVSKGKVTTVTGLKTGDKLVVTTQKKAETEEPGETDAEKNARLKAGVENTTIKLTSTLGKGFIKLNWKKSAGYKVDYYEVYKSKKRYSGYGTEPYFETKQGGLTGWYKNTKELKKGTRYYYKVRGVRDIAGETVYTQYSNKAWRLVK